MPTNQPEWKFVANYGDANPLDHGGKFLFIDETGVYPPELEIVEPTGSEDSDGDFENYEWEVHRFRLERCTYVNGVLSNNQFHQDHPAWFASDLAGVVSCCDTTVEKLIQQLTSDDPKDRAVAYLDLIGYHGPYEFDQYPLHFDDRKEIEARYADLRDDNGKPIV